MLYSATINVMVKAARRAGRSLKRDLGEIEHLQVSLKGPANYVSLADKRAEEIVYQDLAKARPGYGFIGEEGGTREGSDKSQHLDRRSARRHHQLPARHPAIRDLDRAFARGHDHRRRDLQPRQ
ncbi:3'-phosphoadenosine 5'-phosphosulfate (PAPS) 3'-phosphatase [Bradyrhizobium sp. LB7.2]